IEGVSGQAATVQSLQLFGYVIGALVIGVFFYVITVQKVALVAMLKAIGAGNGFILRQILVQVVLVTIVGLVLATPLAWLTERGLSGASEVPIAFSMASYITTVMLLLVTAVSGGLMSARQIVKTEPLLALGIQQ